MEYRHKLTIAAVIGAALLGLLLGCAVQTPSQASEPLRFNYHTEVVPVDGGREVTCVVLDYGVYGVSLSCDWANAT